MSERANVPHIDFQVMLRDHIKTLPDEEREEAETAMSETGQASMSIVNELSQSLFNSQPWASTGFIAENFPAGKANAEFLVTQKLHLDAVVHLKSDQDALGARVIRNRQLKTAKDNLQRSTPLTEDEIKSESDEISDRVVKQSNHSEEVASLIESISSIPMIEINANRFIRAISSDITNQTKNFIEYVSFLDLSNQYLAKESILKCPFDT
jgi:adenylate kinase family enzyme